MSREIKFRAAITSDHWDEHPMATTLVSANNFTLGELWDRDVELKFSDGGCLPFSDIDWSSDKVEYLQFTGLKDRNGKEIYEGDILGDEGVVRWCNDCVGFQSFWEYNGQDICHQCDGDYHITDCIDDSPIIVIGNIYEHPNLLEAK